MSDIPNNLVGLHKQEEELRLKALPWIKSNERLLQHITLVELSMDLADLLRQFDTSDEDLKVIQLLGMRTFNAFGASLKLAFSGYFQNSALVMRDILETVFLIDLFQRDKTLISKWRTADKKERIREFRPVRVREKLDTLDGYTSKKRAETYGLFSELAGHPTMRSACMMRPEKEGDAVIGPFMEITSLEAVISEMGRLAIQVGEQLDLFFPEDWDVPVPSRLAFAKSKKLWLDKFYPVDEKT